MKERTIIVTLTTDTEESLDVIRKGIEMELNCAWPLVEVVDVEEVEPHKSEDAE